MRPVMVSVNGKQFPSISAAARSAGIRPSALKNRIKAGWPEETWLEPSQVGPRPVRCINTGIEYPSMSEAARQAGVSVTSVFNCVVAGTAMKTGMKWEYVQ